MSHVIRLFGILCIVGGVLCLADSTSVSERHSLALAIIGILLYLSSIVDDLIDIKHQQSAIAYRLNTELSKQP